MMRNFAKISPKFWIGKTGRQICKLDLNAKFIALYLMTSPHSNMLGIYYLPINYIAHDTCISFEEASKGLAELCELGFCSFDGSCEYIWVHNMALYQVAEQLKANDKRVIAINKSFAELPELIFIGNFFNKYKDLFHLNNTIRTDLNIIDEPIKTLQCPLEDPTMAHIVNTVEEIFQHWKQIMQHPNAKLDTKRKATIGKALRSGYSLEQLCQAISGCSYTPHNMGDNDRGQRYDGLHIILRDGDQIDRFVHNYHNPPKPLSVAERKTQANIHNLQSWMQEKMTEGSN